MKARKLFLIVLSTAIPLLINAQATYQKSYSIQAIEPSFNSVKTTSDGGYIIAGGHFDIDDDGGMFLLKTNYLGDTLWTKNYDDASNIFYGSNANSVVQTFDGGYFVAGSSQKGLDVNAYVVRTDSNGDTLWTRLLGQGGSTRESYTQAIQTSDSNFITIGIKFLTDIEFFLSKWSNNGVLLWSNTYSSPDYDFNGLSVYETADHGLIAGGFCYHLGANSQAFITKTDSAGNIQWTKAYGNLGTTYCYSVLQTADGGYLFAGSTNNFGPGSSNAFLVKTNNTGDTLWTRAYGAATLATGFNSLKKTSDHRYILAGAFEEPGTFYFDMCLAKIDTSGNLSWARGYGNPSIDDQAREVSEGIDGGFIVCGYTESPIETAYIVKTENYGSSGCNETFLNLSTSPAPFQVDTINLNITTGSTAILRATSVQSGATENIHCYDEINEALNGTMVGIYPNPSTGNISVKTSALRLSSLKITLSDAVGKTVLVKNIKLPSHDIPLDLSGLVNGIYLIRIDDGNGSFTQKLVLNK